MPDFRQLLDKTFGGKHFSNGQPALTLTIKSVSAKEVGEDREVKPVISFVEDARGLVLNSTKYKTLTDAHASAETEKWVGARVELFGEKVKFKRDMVDSVGLRVVVPAPTVAA